MLAGQGTWHVEPFAKASTREGWPPHAGSAQNMKGLGQHTEKQHEAKTAGEYRQAAEEHTQTLKSFWKNFLVSGLFVVAAIVIILACLAWFMNNSRVNATGVGVSAAGARYSLAADTDGESNPQAGYYERTPAERQKIEGSFDLLDSMTVTLSSNLNNYNAGTIYPGARGEIKFKVVAIAKDLGNVEIDLSRILNFKDEKKLDGNAKQQLNGIAEGHVLFFRNCQNGFYSSRVEDNKFVISSSEFTDENERTVEVTLYWVWPEYLQNYVYVGNANYYKNLFAEVGKEDSDYNAMQTFVNSSKDKYYYGSVGETQVPSLGPDMRSTDIATCAALYNNADEFLGNNVQYLQLRISSQEV